MCQPAHATNLIYRQHLQPSGYLKPAKHPACCIKRLPENINFGEAKTNPRLAPVPRPAHIGRGNSFQVASPTVAADIRRVGFTPARRLPRQMPSIRAPKGYLKIGLRLRPRQAHMAEWQNRRRMAWP